MSATPTPPASNLTRWRGRLQLWYARFLHRTVSGRKRADALAARRDRVIRAAHANGQQLDDIAKALDVSLGNVRRIINKQRSTE